MLSANMAENNSSRIEFPDKDLEEWKLFNNFSRIEFPDKDPEEWKLFYQFIDPNKIGAAKLEATIDDKNAKTLIPWFNEFQMEAHVEECDKVLSEKVATLAKTEEKALCDGIIELLQFACVYDLRKTKARAECVIEYLLEEILVGTSDLFDRPIIKELVELFLPIEGVEEISGLEITREFESHGKSKVLWNYLENKGFDAMYLKGLSLENINNSDMLPLLVETFMQHCTSLEDALETKESARKIIEGWFERSPQELYNRLEYGNNSRTTASTCLIEVFQDQFKSFKNSFRKLGIAIPIMTVNHD